MPSKKSEPTEVAVARFHKALGEFLMVLGETIFQAGRKRQIMADRKIKQWIITERMLSDEEH